MFLYPKVVEPYPLEILSIPAAKELSPVDPKTLDARLEYEKSIASSPILP